MAHATIGVVEKFKANGHAAILGVGHCSTCAPADDDARRSPSTRCTAFRPSRFIPAFSIASSTRQRVPGPRACAESFRASACDGQVAEELAYIEGKDPITGRPVMREVIEGLTRGLAAEASWRTAPHPAGSAGYRRQPAPAVSQNNWTDKHADLLPTEATVAAMLAGTSHKPDEVVGKLQMTANRGQWEVTGREGDAATR